MAGYTYATLTTAIQNYTEVDSTLFTSTIIDDFIMGAENRINRDVATDAQRKYQTATLIVGQPTYNSPGDENFIRAIKLTDSNNDMWYLQKVDQTFLDEYTQDEVANTGKPRYYAMFQAGQGAQNNTNYYKIAPSPDATYTIEVEYSIMPAQLSAGNTQTYLSQKFPTGLLYACLIEAYGFLKGPMDMLTYYENRYKQEVDKFGLEQLGRRRRGDYTSGTIRIPMNTPSTTDAGLIK
tara:strand:- start:253 stop:963 length:711 start_codon:yes stop_codon:yes gene_type:complete